MIVFDCRASKKLFVVSRKRRMRDTLSLCCDSDRLREKTSEVWASCHRSFCVSSRKLSQFSNSLRKRENMERQEEHCTLILLEKVHGMCKRD